MYNTEHSNFLTQSRTRFQDIIDNNNLNDVELQVLAKPLTPEEAIGVPGRRDFPIIIGKERVIEAIVLGSRGQAFTDSPSEYIGKLGDIMDLPLDSNRNRALLVATINAVMKHLGLVEGTIHCKDDDPEICAMEIASHCRKSGAKTVGLIGLNPAIAEALSREFGAKNVRIADLDKNNIGSRKFDVEIIDGASDADYIIRSTDIVLITGTTFVNGTFDGLWDAVTRYGKKSIIFGVTAAGIAKLMNLHRLCPCAR